MGLYDRIERDATIVECVTTSVELALFMTVRHEMAEWRATREESVYHDRPEASRRMAGDAAGFMVFSFSRCRDLPMIRSRSTSVIASIASLTERRLFYGLATDADLTQRKPR